MRYNRIPGTDLDVSVVCLGSWVLGGDNWGQADEKDGIEAVLTAVDYGVNFIDTAAIYGRGLAEVTIGKAIKKNRDKLVIAAKCGLVADERGISVNLKPDSIRRELEASLGRMKIGYVDLYQCHWPDPNTPLEDTIEEMVNLKKEGKIRYIGVSNFGLDLLRGAAALAGITTAQNHYSLLERSIEKNLLPFCFQHKIGVLAYGSLGGGILTGKYEQEPHLKKNDARSFFYKFYKGKEFERAQKIISALKEISNKIKKPLSQAAINWINQREGVVSAIVGCRNRQQAEDNMLSGTWQLCGEDISFLNSMSRIDNEV